MDAVGGISFLGGLIYLGTQVADYLKSGYWTSNSVAAWWIKNVDSNGWLARPTNWFGLHNVVYSSLDFFGMSAFFILLGIILFTAANYGE